MLLFVIAVLFFGGDVFEARLSFEAGQDGKRVDGWLLRTARGVGERGVAPGANRCRILRPFLEEFEFSRPESLCLLKTNERFSRYRVEVFFSHIER